MKKSSISIMVPAYNEEKYLAKTISAIVEAVQIYFQDYEIMIFDDCSKDNTGKVADNLALKNTHIRVIHNNPNRGLGYNYARGIKLAKKEYYCWIPGDQGNDKYVKKSFRSIFQNVGQEDILTVYTQFVTPRPFYRILFSKFFTFGVNVLFSKRIKYYCGISVYKTKDIQKISITSSSFSMNAEALLKLMSKGKTVKEIPFYLLQDYGPSNLFKPKNFYLIPMSILKLFVNIRLRKKYT